MADINNAVLLIFENDDEEEQPSQFRKFISKYKLPLSIAGGALAMGAVKSHPAQFAINAAQSKYHMARAQRLIDKNPSKANEHMAKSILTGLNGTIHATQSPLVMKLGMKYAASKI